MKNNVKESLTRWIIDDCMPYDVVASCSFQGMIHALNANIDIPTQKTVKNWINTLKADTETRMKAMLQGKFFSFMIDHWTLIA